MLIETKVAKRYWVRKALLTLMFFGFGCLALYDGIVKYPKEIDAWSEYSRYNSLKERKNTSALSRAEAQEFALLDTKFSDPSVRQPRERHERDIRIQYTLAAICFPASAVFVLTWLLSARRKYIIREDGTLVAPEGVFPADSLTDVDMTKWMDKSIAVVEIRGGPAKGGTAVKLDAWIYDGLDEVIEKLARRFHPDEFSDQLPSLESQSQAKSASPGQGESHA